MSTSLCDHVNLEKPVLSKPLGLITLDLSGSYYWYGSHIWGNHFENMWVWGDGKKAVETKLWELDNLEALTHWLPLLFFSWLGKIGAVGEGVGLGIGRF